MKSKQIIVGAIVAIVMALSIVVVAQVSRLYRNGSVWNVAYIRVKPGMNAAYITYLATNWKKNQDAAKKEGLLSLTKS